MNDFYMSLLSAGVIVAIVEGFFSIFLASRNNKLLREQQKNEQNFEIRKKQYELLTQAYETLMQELPENKKLSHVLMNSTFDDPEKERSDVESQMEFIGATASEEEMILVNHFRKYGYLLNESQNEEIRHIIDEHDKLVIAQDLDWLVSIVQFEETYSQAIQDKLSELAEV